MKRITDDVDPVSSFDELGFAQMSILAMVSSIEPFMFATTAVLKLSGPEGFARKSSFVALSWTRTFSCIGLPYNGHTQPFACPRSTTSPMWLACDTSTRSSLSTCRSASLFRCTSSSSHRTFTSQGSPLPATKHDANSSSLGRTGLCVERFLASLFRCSRASAVSERAKHLSLPVINRTNVLKFCLQLRPFQRGLLQWSSHLLPGFTLRHDSCDTHSNFASRLLCPTKPH